MKSHHALLAAVAVGALIGPNANAATKKHAHHHAATAPKDAALKSEVEELKAEVTALREEIKAQRETTAATQTQVATLQTQTSSVAQTASTAAETATTASAKADTAVAKADAVQVAETTTDKKVGAMAWAGDTKIGATVFANYSNINQEVNGVKQSDNGTGFNIKRIYLAVDHKFSNVWSANVTADISNVIGETANNNYTTPTTTVGAPTCTTTSPAAGKYTTTCTAPAAANLGTAALVGKGFYVKFAYIQAKLDPALTIRAGSSDTSWIPYMQNMYGHRYIENVLIDEYKLGNSADWGVQAFGDLAGGLLSYQVGVVNGAGYRNVKVTNSVDLEGRLSTQYKGFFGAVGGYTGKLGNNVQGATNLYHTATRFDAAAGFKNDLFTIGGEYVYAKNFSSVTSLNEDINRGVSGFANYNITPKWQIFGRYDWIRQTAIATATTGAYNPVRNNYFNVGLQWEPVKILDLSLVYKRDTTENLGLGAGTIAEQNGTGTLGGSVNGSYDEFGIFAQVKF
jgi:hypothetical protein